MGETINGVEVVQRSSQSSLAVDVVPQNDPDDLSMLIQGSPYGYKFDMWWGDNSQNCTHIWMSEEQSEEYDNRHYRDVTVDSDVPSSMDGGVRIFDPDPRVPGAGFDGVEIFLVYTGDGFDVLLEWEDQQGNTKQSEGRIPKLDPRNFGEERDEFYQVTEINAQTPD